MEERVTLVCGKGQHSKSKALKVYFLCTSGEHFSDNCTEVKDLKSRREIFATQRLCFNCGQPGHRASNCHGESCFKRKGKHHTSLCEAKKGAILYVQSDTTLPPIVPVTIKGETLWAYLDTGSGRNFASQNAIRKLKLSPTHRETRHVVTINGTR